MGNPNILIIVPAFNEEGNIKRTINEIMSYDLSLSVLVVNDGSQDGTYKEAKDSSAHVVSLPYNLGIGGAVQTGFKFALKYGYDIAVQVDGDGQHDINYLKALIQPIIDNEADMTIGSRFIPPFLGYRSSFVRRIGINFFSFVISFLTKYKVTDPTSGFRAYNKKMIGVFAGYYPIDFPEPEAVLVAQGSNARLTEVPVEMRKRSSGNSSIRYFKTLYYMLKVTFAIFLYKLKSRKEP